MAETLTREVEAPTPTGNRETHVPRDELERPLVGLCGYVARSPTTAPRDRRPDELGASCVVCADLWAAGVRPTNWHRG